MAGRFNPEMVESLNRNHWSICPGITGRFAPESVVDLGRNTHPMEDLEFITFSVAEYKETG